MTCRWSDLAKIVAFVPVVDPSCAIVRAVPKYDPLPPPVKDVPDGSQDHVNARALGFTYLALDERDRHLLDYNCFLLSRQLEPKPNAYSGKYGRDESPIDFDRMMSVIERWLPPNAGSMAAQQASLNEV